MAKTQALAKERLRDIELLLLWEGQVGNARLRSLFGIQITQASVLIRQYRDAFPQACRWDSVLRTHIASRVKPAVTGGSLDEYVAMLSRSREGTGRGIHVVHRDLSLVSPAVFRAIHQATGAGRGVNIQYRSMRNSTPHSRLIFPHAIVQAGGRWHARAYVSGDDPGFRDFNLGRVQSAVLENAASPEKPSADEAWETEVIVRLVPHPALSHEQQAIIRQEYAAGAAARAVKTRGALVPYLLQEQRIAFDPQKQKPPEYQLAIANMDQIRRWLFPR